MTRYNNATWPHNVGVEEYREGVDRVLEYIESTYSYPKLYAELKRAIEEGII